MGGWTDGTKLKAKNVKDDFTGLPSNIWNRLEVDLKECYNWNGKFQKRKKRKKREVEDVGELEDVGEVGEVGEEAGEADAGNLLNWAKELFPWGSVGSAEGGLRRRKRASIKGKNSSDKKTKGKKTGKKKGKKSGTKKKKKSKEDKSGSKSSEKS